MSRGFVQILQLDFKGALAANVLSVPLFIMCVIYFFLAIIDVFSQKSYIEKLERLLAKKYMYVAYALTLVAATWINNIDLF